ncbi:hypothetical protein [Paenibacillus naphthalenovorans]|uniref:Uncharacterized protein n=1 Tax=Paenibacillus naphthalenovorans TaxID=162209 RepID=A0A0U2KYV4_9BACL|nr:hypothetical protein [Paenibacillus naphthalenovorans]ALS22146.1 hypothetical protein IJ22_17720 [Paenibacillus naphthalenovorans]
MLINNQIELHQKSVDYVKEVFSKYIEVEQLDSIVTNPIIHIYPKKDTYEQDGKLNGYIDALFSEFHVYDTEKKTVWKSKRLHDGICPYEDLYVNQIKIFKDLSTMISLKGKYIVSGSYTTFDIYKYR